jgi:hypothetical protein
MGDDFEGFQVEPGDDGITHGKTEVLGCDGETKVDFTYFTWVFAVKIGDDWI